MSRPITVRLDPPKLATATAVAWVLCALLQARVGATLVINEFMASNGSTGTDPQGDYDDWIEIYNAGPQTVDLGGMHLTDDLLNPTQWQFPPDTFIGPGGYLLVWADEDLLDNPNGLHASFKLSAGGEEIGLYATNGLTLVDSISFGDQLLDVSFGRFPNGSSTWYPMDQPTPNSANATAASEEVYFSRLGGVMTNSFTLKLSTKSNTGQIRYTTDGSIPTASSILYNDAGGISINNSDSRRVRARAFQSGLAPGPVRTEAWLAVSPALAAFNSNLPIMMIDTFGQAMPPVSYSNNMVIHADPIATYSAIIDTNKTTARATVTDEPDYAGRAGVRIRGQSTAELDKKPYKLETWDEDDADRRVSLLGLPADSDWVLHNPHTDKTFMRNALVFQWSNEMGHYSSRTRFFELFINEDGGQIGGPGSSDYVGIYVLMEHIKRGKDRVDIEELRPTHTAEPEITGGYVLRHDKDRPEASFSTWAGRWFYVEPSDLEITTPQKNYIKNYIQEFEAVLQGASFSNPTNGYAKYIEVESFIDHDFLSEITREVDAYTYSTYVTKDRGGKLVMSPEWDYNWSMGNNDYSGWGLTLHHTGAWHRDGGTEYRWHKRLRDDPEYRLKYADRWFHLRETVLSDAGVAQDMDTHFALLNAEAAARNFSRWNILNSFVGFYWVNPPVPDFYYGGNTRIPCYSADHTYGMGVEWMKNWMTGTGTPSGSCAAAAYAPQYSDRLGWIDNNMPGRMGAGPPPALYLNGNPANTGSTISVPATLTMTGSAGTIYYTLDGTDPRQAFTGNAVGTAYSGGIVLNKTADVRARIKNGSSWSAMNRAVFADDRVLGSLRITEIMYHPETAGREYVELKNIGTTPISMYRCELTDGIRFTFPDVTLAAGQHILVVENLAAFQARYGTGHNVAGEFGPDSALDNSGEEIVLRDAAGREIHDFDFKDWYPVTDGRGASLCIIDPANADLTLWDRKAGWQASSIVGGSPDAPNAANVLPNGSIVINEILPHTDAAGGDWIELHNTTGVPIDIGGWFLSDSIDDLQKYRIAPGTSIPAGGFIAFTQDANFGVSSTDPGRLTGFGLSELGESVFLSSGAGTNLTGGYSTSADFGAAANGITFGRHTKSATAGYDVDVAPMASPTPGASNAAPLVPAAVISQIMYHPSSHPDELAEYIELFNRSRTAVSLYDLANPSNTWRFTRGIDYTFPPGISIPAGAHILVVRTDPDIFRSVHNIPLSRPIYGPWSDSLDNDGETIELSMPGAPEPGLVPYVAVEKVTFSDGLHPVGGDAWPTGADGAGAALHRVSADGYGNDVANWQAAAPTPVSPDVPVIELQQNGGTASLVWTGSGVLQSAPQLSGPWTNVPAATSPYLIVIGGAPQNYYRIQQSVSP